MGASAEHEEKWAYTVTVRLRRLEPATGGVSADSFTVEGLVVSPEGTSARFTGWLGLVGELERLVDPIARGIHSDR